MPIEFRNPLATQGSLLARLRTMIGRSESGSDVTAAAAGTESASSNDRVSLSSDALDLASGQPLPLSATYPDASRVAELKQAIENGNFRIDSDRIASKVSLLYGRR
ncbi:MAG: flagellar biosynthesis anti-sigma factor FlgM [Pseudomonadota bacterium]